MVNQYYTGGLRIDTDLQIDELARLDASSRSEANVVMEIGEVPHSLDGGLAIQDICYFRDDLTLINLPAARYLIEGGRRVVIEPKRELCQDVLTGLLSPVLAVLFLKNGYLSLHAASVAREGGEAATLFMGRSGVGKSTLALGFERLGYRILNDDISSICARKGVPLVYPGNRHLKLWRDSLAAHGISTEGLSFVGSDVNKYRYLLGESVGLEPLPVRRIYEIALRSHGSLEVEKLAGVTRFTAITRHLFRRRLVGIFNLKREIFEKQAAFERVPVFRVHRPIQTKPKDLVAFVKNHIDSEEN